MRIAKETILTAILVVVCTNAKSMPTEEAKNNLGMDFAVCTAYYNLWLVEAKKAGLAAKDILRIQGSAESSTQLGTAITNPAVFLSRVELATNDMVKVVNSEGWSRLILKHNDQCKSLLENPDTRLKYWLNR